MFLGGKGLEKNEQCSDWLCRPLTREQREYACLDAWACAAIYLKIIHSLSKVNSLSKDANHDGRMQEVMDPK
jgi:ribonuclease D